MVFPGGSWRESEGRSLIGSPSDPTSPSTLFLVFVSTPVTATSDYYVQISYKKRWMRGEGEGDVLYSRSCEGGSVGHQVRPVFDNPFKTSTKGW